MKSLFHSKFEIGACLNENGNGAPEKHEFRLLSACREESRNHQIDYENIEIMDKASTDLKLKMKELLHILKRKPELNKQLNSQSNYDIKTLIIAAYPQFRKNDGKHGEVDRP